MSAMDWANSQHGNPLMGALYLDLIHYGFNEDDANSLLILLAHNVHLYVKHK